MTLNTIIMGKCLPLVPQMGIFLYLMYQKRTSLTRSAALRLIKDQFGRFVGLIHAMGIFWHHAALTEK